MTLPVHILGAGAMGGLVAHSLARQHPEHAAVTLLLRNAARAADFQRRAGLTVVSAHRENVTSATVPLRATTLKDVVAAAEPIANLVVATKAYQTEAALEPYHDLLGPDSNIVFLHNGMGVIDRIARRLWPGNVDRPRVFKALSTHGAFKTAPAVVNHVGLGSLTVAYVPRRKETATCELVDLLVDTPALAASVVPYDRFRLMELEKLAVNACINPLTALMDCLNGDLLHGSKVVVIMRRVLMELVAVVRADNPALFTDNPEASSYLSPDNLLNSVLEVCRATARNSSSMREDVRNLNNTEIDFINGYITHLGYHHGVPTPANNMLVSMVKTKLSIEQSLDSAAADLLV